MKLKMIKKALPILLFLCMAFAAKAQDKGPLLKPTGVVTDFENVFSGSQETKLTNIVNEIIFKTGYQIAVVTIDSIAPYNSALELATYLGNEWGVGDSATNNGIVILLSFNTQQIAIATGLGVEDVLTDDLVKEIIENEMIPQFRKERFYLGTEKALDRIIDELLKEKK